MDHSQKRSQKKPLRSILKFINKYPWTAGLASVSNSQKFNKYFLNTVWMFVDKAVSMFFAVFVGIWVARYLGPANYGRLNYAISLVAFFIPFATLGMNRVMIRDVVQFPEQRDSLLGTTFVLRSISSLICFLVVAFLAINTEREYVIQKILFVVGLGLLLQPFSTLNDYFLSQVQARYASVASIFSKLFSSGMRILLIVSKLDVIYFALAVVVESIALSIGYCVGFWRNKLRFIDWRFNNSSVKSLLSASWPVIFANLSFVIYQRVDQVILQKMLGAYAVGVFSASVRIYEPLVGLAAIIGSSVYPQFINLYQTNQKRYWFYYEALSTIMAFGGWCIVVVTIFLGKSMIMSLFGQEYSATAQILTYHIFSLCIMFACFLRAGHINIINKNWILMITTFSSMVLNVCLNYVLISKMGVTGAALASVVTQVSALIVLDLMFTPTRNLFFVNLRAFLVFPGLVNTISKYRLQRIAGG